MSRHNTVWLVSALLAAIGLPGGASAQAQPRPWADWRPIGNTLQLLDLAGPASGAVERVWFDGDPARLHVRLPGGRHYESADLESWILSSATPPAARERVLLADRSPEAGPLLRAVTIDGAYAAGQDLWRSEDGGRTWRNLTRWRDQALLGGPVLDVAVSPVEPQRVAVATTSGVWISHDGGLTWAGLNEGLPNLPVRRLLAPPSGARGLRVAVEHGGSWREMEWAPGHRTGWIPGQGAGEPAELALRAQLSRSLDAIVTAAAAAGDALYAGGTEGRLWASVDRGQTWRLTSAGSGSVEKIWLDPADSRFAVAALSPAGDERGPRVVRTLNGGTWWDDLSANLPDGPVWGLAADRNAGVLYAATQRGIYWAATDLRAPAPPPVWMPLAGNLPEGPVRDVMLDDAGARLYAAADSAGVFVTPAPHRYRSPLVVHSADYAPRAAAPGALLSLIGLKVETAAANRNAAPILAATDQESQFQVPFEASGDSVQLVFDGSAGRVAMGLPLRPAAPAILVDRDGSPMLLDAETGVQIDAMHPARGGMLLQILSSGLGRVEPDWPSGLPAPLEDAPRVRGPVRVLLDGAALEVTRATLAPGYIGYYLVEVRLPDFLDAGLSELVVEAGGNASNRVRVYVDR